MGSGQKPGERPRRVAIRQVIKSAVSEPAIGRALSACHGGAGGETAPYGGRGAYRGSIIAWVWDTTGSTVPLSTYTCFTHSVRPITSGSFSWSKLVTMHTRVVGVGCVYDVYRITLRQ